MLNFKIKFKDKIRNLFSYIKETKNDSDNNNNKEPEIRQKKIN